MPVVPPRVDQPSGTRKTPRSSKLGEGAFAPRRSTPEAEQLLRARASLCELSNVHQKTRFTLASVLVRGLEKVTCATLLAALTHNILAHGPKLLSDLGVRRS